MLVARLALGRGWLWTLWLRSAVHERALVEPGSDRTDERSRRLQEAKPHDRSPGGDSAKRGGYPSPSGEVYGRGDRSYVSHRFRAEAAARDRDRGVLPRASRAAVAVCGVDAADEPRLRCKAGELRRAARDTTGAVPQGAAQG